MAMALGQAQWGAHGFIPARAMSGGVCLCKSDLSRSGAAPVGLTVLSGIRTSLRGLYLGKDPSLF